MKREGMPGLRVESELEDFLAMRFRGPPEIDLHFND